MFCFSSTSCLGSSSSDGEHTGGLLPPGGKKTDGCHALQITYEASVCRELRNLPCSRFSLYTSELQRKKTKSILSLTNTETYCYKLGGLIKNLADSLILPNFQTSHSKT